ncbi:hypothetical protein D1818_08125 [Aquimarina sp. BL5]|uniref:hypothetical protein n=1 Tax=Aquimarina sp. BL5 TaxID=1714860 RepID=UPI000E4CCF4B|nr:hypothetical protein [Aquimarina sp. BL5]AXT50798.1 hypothetical protein D1818_08125 [Aquimarina sp. BL5]
MLKNILNLNGVQKLKKEEQKSVQGGNPILIEAPSCNYYCSGTTARLSNGNYLNCPAIIHNAPQCNGDDDGIEIWA